MHGPAGWNRSQPAKPKNEANPNEAKLENGCKQRKNRNRAIFNSGVPNK